MMMWVGHVLDHVLDHVIDHMMIDLVTTALQLPFSLALALTNK